MKLKKYNIAVFVSRDYQISNIEKIVNCGNDDVKITFISNDNYIKGNSVESLLNKNYLLLINKKRLPLVINTFLNINLLIRDLIKKNNNVLFFLDEDEGFHVTIALILCITFKLKLIFYQHGYSWTPTKKFTWDRGWIFETKREIIKKNIKIFIFIVFLSILFDRKNILRKVIYLLKNYNSKLIYSYASIIITYYDLKKRFKPEYHKKIKSIGSVNYSNIKYEKKFDINIDRKVIYFTTGALRSNNKKAIYNQLKSISFYLKKFKNYKFIIKIKPGEDIDDLNRLVSDNVYIQKEKIKQYNKNDIVILPVDSNTCIELIQSNIKFITYNIFENNSECEIIISRFLELVQYDQPINKLLKRYNIITKYNVENEIFKLLHNELLSDK